MSEPATIWEAARKAFAEAGGCAEERLSAALKAAEPLIAAAERKRCAQQVKDEKKGKGK